VINFDEELKKYHPSLELEDAEQAIYNERHGRCHAENDQGRRVRDGELQAALTAFGGLCGAPDICRRS